MSWRVGWFGFVPVLFISACASVWDFDEFHATDAASENDASDASDGTVAEANDVGAEAGGDHSISDVGASALDAGNDSANSTDAEASIDAFVDAAPPPPMMDAACASTCPTGAICENGTCACSTAPDFCSSGCVDFQTDPSNCGACGRVCTSGANCVTGSCTCPTAEPLQCSSGCVDSKTDHENCGGCGAACDAGSACHEGACTVCGSSPSDQKCSGVCVDLSADVTNCGSCGHRCPENSTCTNGVCGCQAGDPTMCTVKDAGACVDTQTDHANCGGCGNACKLPHASSVCKTGSCAISACVMGYTPCNNSLRTGAKPTPPVTRTIAARAGRSATCRMQRRAAATRPVTRRRARPATETATASRRTAASRTLGSIRRLWGLQHRGRLSRVHGRKGLRRFDLRLPRGDPRVFGNMHKRHVHVPHVLRNDVYDMHRSFAWRRDLQRVAPGLRRFLRPANVSHALRQDMRQHHGRPEQLRRMRPDVRLRYWRNVRRRSLHDRSRRRRQRGFDRRRE